MALHVRRAVERGRPRPTRLALFRTVVTSAAMVLVAFGGLAVLGAARADAASPGRGGFVSIRPFRLVDTRGAGGVPYSGAAFGAGETRTYRVYAAGNAQVPSGAVGSLALNVTAVTPPSNGFLTVWPQGETMPTASVLNYGPGSIVPNAVTVKVSGDGSFNVFAQTSTHVVIDVMGYYANTSGTPDGGGFQGIAPKRLMDTRERLGGSRFASGGVASLAVTGSGAAPAGAVAVVLNVTVTGTAGPGFLTVWPNGLARPTVSNLNYVAGQTRANQVTVKVGSGGAVSIFAQTATDVVVDIMGWYAGGATTAGGFVPIDPVRVMDTRINLGDVHYDPSTDSIIMHVGGLYGVPANAAAVSLNVTAVFPTADSYLTVFPDGNVRPLSSNLNFAPDDVVPNAVTVGLGAEQGVEFYSPAFLDVLADLGGYYTAS
jgi:hypothetical protein